jgi:hypothetical protein
VCAAALASLGVTSLPASIVNGRFEKSKPNLAAAVLAALLLSLDQMPVRRRRLRACVSADVEHERVPSRHRFMIQFGDKNAPRPIVKLAAGQSRPMRLKARARTPDQLAQKCHKASFKNWISDCRCGVFPKPEHSIGNGEVDSSILSGSTTFSDPRLFRDNIQRDTEFSAMRPSNPVVRTCPYPRRANSRSSRSCACRVISMAPHG